MDESVRSKLKPRMEMLREGALVQFVTGDIDGRRVAVEDVEAPWTGMDDDEGMRISLTQMKGMMTTTMIDNE